MTLADGPMRFNALKRRIEGVSQKMLSQTLRQMERDGLATRSVEATVPVSVTYAITPLGQTLVQALQPVIDWAETRMPEVELAQASYDRRAV
ncbi:HTH-type transcriptional activator HxlR [compost metagenome]